MWREIFKKIEVQNGELAAAQISRCVLRVDAPGSPGEHIRAGASRDTNLWIAQSTIQPDWIARGLILLSEAVLCLKVNSTNWNE